MAKTKAPPRKAAGTRRKGRSLVRDYGEAVFVAAVLFLFLRTFVVQAYQIPSASMEDTLLVGDFLVANKFLYGARMPGTSYRLPEIRDPARGDIIVFRAPHQDKDFIKRCVAVEGDTVQVMDNSVYLNGEQQPEGFVAIKEASPAAVRLQNWGPKVIPEDYILMLGDNRNQKPDSRDWGLLHKNRVEGKAMFLYFSWDKNQFLPRFKRFFRPIH